MCNQFRQSEEETRDPAVAPLSEEIRQARKSATTQERQTAVDDRRNARERSFLWNIIKR